MCAEFNGGGVRPRPDNVPNTEESKRFSDDIWSVMIGHNWEAEYLKDIKNELENRNSFRESGHKCWEGNKTMPEDA